MSVIITLVLLLQIVELAAVVALLRRQSHVTVQLPQKADMVGVFETPLPHAPQRVFRLMDESGRTELHEITKHAVDVPETYSYAGRTFHRIMEQGDGSYVFVREPVGN